MGAWNFHVHLRVHSPTVAPVHDAIVARIDGGFNHRSRNFVAERIEEIAGALSRITVGQDAAAVLVQDAKAYRLGRPENGPICYRAPDGGGQSGQGCHILRPLTRQRTSDHSSEAVADQMDFASGFRQGFVESLVESSLDQEVWTFCINSDSRKVGPVSDTPEPGVQFCKVNIGAKEAGNEDHGRSIATRNP